MRFLALGLVAVLGLVGSAVEPGRASLAQPTALTIETSQATVGTGDSLKVHIRATITGEPLQGYALRLQFNDEVFIAARCDYTQDPQRLPSVCNPGFATNEVAIGGYQNPPVTGEWLLASVVLAATGSSGSTSDLTIDVVEFSTANGAPLNPLTDTATVGIEGIGTTAIVLGSTFEDTNENGTLNAGEPGIDFREVTLSASPLAMERSSSRPDGKFVFADVEPGLYQISTELDHVFTVGCPTDSPPTLNPLGYPVCPVQRDLFEPTTPEVADVTTQPGAIARVNFGGRRMDVQDVGGQAIFRGDYAPAGATITARSNGNVCGSTTVSPVGLGVFEMEVRGGGELPGCPDEGQIVAFEVAGLPADQAPIWTRSEPIGRIDPIAMPDHAWFWLEQPADANVAFVGTKVEAVIDGEMCGTATIGKISSGFAIGSGSVGFSRLVIPRDTISPRCGRTGATIRFLVGGTDSGVVATWQPGIHRLELPLVPPPSGIPAPTPNQLPSAGASPGRSSASWPLAAGFASTLFSAACLSIVAISRLRRDFRS